MEKKMCSYETLFAVNGNYTEEEFKAVEEKFLALINENGTDVTVDEWGKRRFAYPINYVTEGYYVLVNYKSAPDFPLELGRVFGITEGILRHMTTVAAKSEAKAAKVEETKAEENVEVAAEATEA